MSWRAPRDGGYHPAESTPEPTTPPSGSAGASSPRPAAPDATAGDGLREAIAGAARDWEARHAVGSFVTTPEQFANAVLALPALRDVLAAAARDAEKVRRERDRHQPTGNLTAGDDYCTFDGHIWPCAARKALDGPT